MPTCFSDLSLMLMLDVRQAGVNKLTLASGSATNRGSADDLPGRMRMDVLGTQTGQIMRYAARTTSRKVFIHHVH